MKIRFPRTPLLLLGCLALCTARTGPAGAAEEAGSAGVDEVRKCVEANLPEDSSVQTVVLTLHPPRFSIEEAEVLDAVGNRILYRFSGIKRNRGIQASEFHFEPPPGTEIVAHRHQP